MLSQQELLEASPIDYMNDDQVEFFRHRLLTLCDEAEERLKSLKEALVGAPQEADSIDVASSAAARERAQRLIARECDTIAQTRSALRRIRDGEFGYCGHTGEEIGLRRLIAQPTASFSVAAQERIERKRAQFA